MQIFRARRAPASLHIFFFYFRLLLLLIFPPSGERGKGEDNHFNRVGLFKKKEKEEILWFDWNLHKDVMLYSRLIPNLYTGNHFLLLLLRLLCRRQGESIWLLTQLVCWLFGLLPTIALGGLPSSHPRLFKIHGNIFFFLALNLWWWESIDIFFPF